MIIFIAGVFPKFSALLTTIPYAVLGGATVSVFASIAMTGMKLVMTEDMNYRNTSIVGLAAALGMGVSQASASLSAFPAWVTTIFGKDVYKRQVADSCAVSLDRRMTAGETWESCLDEIRALPAVKKYGEDVKVSMYEYNRPSYTCLLYTSRCV